MHVGTLCIASMNFQWNSTASEWRGLSRSLVVGLLLLACLPARGQGLPASLKASLLVRILAYDRRMGTSPPPLTIAVLHREGDTGSRERCQELGSALESVARGRAVAGRSLRVVSLGFQDAERLQGALATQHAVALYVCEGLEADTGRIAQVTRRLSILSFAGSRDQLDQGLAIGLGRRGDSPVILVHLSAARAEGADLDAGLLSLSLLVEPGRPSP
jgi:YfiR/HmsC-like